MNFRTLSDFRIAQVTLEIWGSNSWSYNLCEIVPEQRNAFLGLWESVHVVLINLCFSNILWHEKKTAEPYEWTCPLLFRHNSQSLEDDAQVNRTVVDKQVKCSSWLVHLRLLSTFIDGTQPFILNQADGCYTHRNEAPAFVPVV